MAKNIKKRNWAFVLYPESAPADWREQLQKTGLQCAISPLHDKDMNPDNTPKKPHYHVILTYSGPTSYNVVKALTDGFNQPIPQALEQVRGYYRCLRGLRPRSTTSIQYVGSCQYHVHSPPLFQEGGFLAILRQSSPCLVSLVEPCPYPHSLFQG